MNQPDRVVAALAALAIRDSERTLREKHGHCHPIEVREAPGGSIPMPKPARRPPRLGLYREG